MEYWVNYVWKLGCNDVQLQIQGKISLQDQKVKFGWQCFVATLALLVAGSTLSFGYLIRLGLHPPACTQASFKALGCSCNCRWLTCGSFQLTHVTWWPRCSIDQVQASHGSQNEDKILLQHSQHCHKGDLASKHQCTTAITTMCTESSWAFPESYTADDSWIMCSSNGGQRVDKRAHNSTTKISFCTIIVHLCHCMIAIMTV